MTTPLLPLSASVNSILSQDYVASDGVGVDLTSPAAQVAPFCNPAKGGVAEAFLIGPVANSETPVQYLCHDPTQATGWSVTTPFTASGTEVVAAVIGSNADDIFVVWSDSGAVALSQQTAADTWSAPVAVSGAAMTSIGVTYALAPGPTSGTVGIPVDPPIPVVYGVKGNSLQFLQIELASGSPSVDLTATADLTNAQLTTPFSVTIASNTSGQLEWAVIAIDSSTSVPGLWTGMVSGGDVTGPVDFQATRTPVGSIFGAVATPSSSNTPYPLYLDINGVPFMGTSNPSYWDQVLPAPTDDLSMAAVVVGPPPGETGSVAQALLSCYLVSTTTSQLYALRQVGWSNDGALPLWSPGMPIAPDADYVYADLCPTDPPTIFTADLTNEGDLTLYQLVAQSAGSGQAVSWVTTQINLGTSTDNEVSRYRTQVTVYDANGSPVPNYEVDITATAACGVQVGVQTFVIGPNGIAYDPDPGTPTIVTDGSGSLTLAILATSLSPPYLTITDTTGVVIAANVFPAAATQGYLAQTGNPPPGMPPTSAAGNQPFTANTLTTAQTSTGQSLFPGVQTTAANPVPPAQAASGIAQVMAMPSGAGAGAGAGGGAGALVPGPRIAGFIINRVHPNLPSYQEFATSEQFHAARRALPQGFEPGVFHDIGNFFGDVWQGIETGAAVVAHVAVDVANAVVSLAIEIGNVLVQVGDFIVQTVEDALNAVLAIFSALLAIVEDIIKFLEALLNFKTIWQSKLLFEGFLYDKIPTFLGGLITTAETALDNFSDEVITEVGNLFTSLASSFEAQGNPTFNVSAGSVGQQVGSGPSDQPLPATPPSTGSSISASDVTSNPQSGWLQTQVNAVPGVPGPPGTATSISTFFESVGDTLTGPLGQAFESACKDLLDTLLKDVENIGDFGDYQIGQFLLDLGDVVTTGMQLGVALADDFLNMMVSAVEQLTTVLKQPVEIPFLGTLYDLLKGFAGFGSCDDPLDYGSLASLMLAFPYTITYELMIGGAPFPEVQCPPSTDDILAAFAGRATEDEGAGLPFQVASPVLQMAYVIVDWVSDTPFPADATPGWFTTLEIVGPLVISSCAWPSSSGIPFGPIDETNQMAVYAWLSSFLPPAITFVTYMERTFGDSKFSDNQVNDIGKVLTSLAGLLSVILGVVALVDEIGDGTGTVLEGVSDIIVPFPDLFDFLTLHALSDDPVALVFNLCLVFLGDVVGGALDLVGVMEANTGSG